MSPLVFTSPRVGLARGVATHRSCWLSKWIETTADPMCARIQVALTTAGERRGPIAPMLVATQTTGTTIAVGITIAETGTMTAETMIDETEVMTGETAAGTTGTMSADGSAAQSVRRRRRSVAGTTWARTRRTPRCC